MPKPLIVFASCDCVAKDMVALQALHQEHFDGEFIHFRMVCLLCDCECFIKEPFEDYYLFPALEKEVMDFLDSEESAFYLEACLSGKTSSIPKKYKEDKYLRKKSGGHNETRS